MCIARVYYDSKTVKAGIKISDQGERITRCWLKETMTLHEKKKQVRQK